MVVVERFYSLADAESARLELASMGIDVWIEHECASTLTPYLLNAGSKGIELKVDEDSLDQAREILSVWWADRAEAIDNPPFARYRIPILTGIGAALGALVFDPLWLIVTVSIAACVAITIYNLGVDRGYRAAKSEEETLPSRETR